MSLFLVHNHAVTFTFCIDKNQYEDTIFCILRKFRLGFVAQQKWWNGRNPPYEKLIKVGTGLMHLNRSRMTCVDNAQCSKSKSIR